MSPDKRASTICGRPEKLLDSQGPEKPVLALISDAARGKTPRENRNKKSLQNRVRRLSESEVADLVEAYQGGESIYELGRRFEIHRTTVSEHLKRAGVQTRGVKERKLTPEQTKEAIRLRQEGMSFARIATAIGTTEYAVRRELGLLMGEAI